MKKPSADFAITILRGIISLAVFIFLVSCSSPFIGKQYPEDYYQRIDVDGNNYATFEHLSFDYYVFVDKQNNTSHLDGVFEISEKYLSSGWEVDEIQFTLYVLDFNYKVVAVENIRLSPKTTHDEPIKFKKSIILKPNYRYVTYGYKLKSTH